MKKDKKNIVQTLWETLGELILTLLCFGIGVFIIGLFGVDFKSPNIDYDLIILLGVIVFLVIFVVVYFLGQWIKKIIREKRK